MNLKKVCQLSAVLVILVGAVSSFAQITADSHIYAQKLVDETIAKHPELRQLGLHTTPPNSSQSIIIAISDKKKIGKKSDPDDLDVMKTGKPTAELMEKKAIYDLGFPLLDQSGAIIGTAVLEMKLSAENTKEGALRRGKIIQEELQKQIPSKEKLFEKVE